MKKTKSKTVVGYGYVINSWLRDASSLWIPPVYREPMQCFETKVKVTREGKKITIEKIEGMK